MEQPVELRLLELLLLEQQRLALVQVQVPEQRLALVQVPEQALQRLLRPVL
jgi:hypothetical protein